MQDLRPQDLVVCNRRADAAVFRVLAVDGFNVKMVDATLPNTQPQHIDRSLLSRLNRLQRASFARYSQ
jgi:hypothetical protein